MLSAETMAVISAALKGPSAEERADQQAKIEAFRKFVSRRAKNLYWQVFEATGMDRGQHRVVIDGYRHGFGEHEFGPAPLDEVLHEARQLVIANTEPTGTAPSSRNALSGGESE
ncbi:hypothetical protein [Shinella zoogloeoides]|uniref:hypothetical protein n=1 Tax=Shinella zoogloeoides TaxID=352475 RepID=UPI000E656596|nr:hypothetical protein [Shinella zoogloeoides]